MEANEELRWLSPATGLVQRPKRAGGRKTRKEWMKLTLMSCVGEPGPIWCFETHSKPSFSLPQRCFIVSLSECYCCWVFVSNTLLQFVELSYINVWRVEKKCSVWYNQCWGKRTEMNFMFNHKFQHTKTNQSSHSYFQDIYVSKNFRMKTS